VSGFDLVADEVGLDERIDGADLVITGEGFLDEQSFEGKVVGGVAGLADRLGVPVVAIAGQVYDAVGDRIEAVSLVERFGEERARAETLTCVRRAAADILRRHDA
jgi:glycerate kinase